MYIPKLFRETDQAALHDLMRAIVGFSISITRLEGKYKLSQNRPPEDQQRVVEALHRQGDELSTGTAALMRPRVAASPVSPT